MSAATGKGAFFYQLCHAFRLPDCGAEEWSGPLAELRLPGIFDDAQLLLLSPGSVDG
ncbi:MAG: hypothetical protein HYS12_19965 [Planctomycetes bacterium]|nr:hypothetical protein [Planctomycetota bacterium]